MAYSCKILGRVVKELIRKGETFEIVDTEADIKQAFFDPAAEIEAELGDLENQPDIEVGGKLCEQIMEETKKREKISYQNRDNFTDKILERMR